LTPAKRSVEMVRRNLLRVSRVSRKTREKGRRREQPKAEVVDLQPRVRVCVRDASGDLREGGLVPLDVDLKCLHHA
jgi:hypothetical protein